eukprot:677365-Prorocentrum_minimum.AAC.1
MWCRSCGTICSIETTGSRSHGCRRRASSRTRPRTSPATSARWTPLCRPSTSCPSSRTGYVGSPACWFGQPNP